MIPLWANSLGLNAGLSFWLPLDDLGAGAVNTTPIVAAGSPTPTFSRATTAYTVNAAGVLVSVNSGVARSAYDFTSLAYLGYLAEESRTNYITFSNDLSNAAWAKRNGHVVTSVNNPAPDGTNTASLITVTGGSPGTSQGVFTESAANGNVAYDGSMYLKNNSGITSVTIVIKDRGSDVVRATKLVSVASSWTRVDLTGTPAGASAGFRFEFQAEQANGSFFVWGAQGEAGVFATSVMPTSGATFTRSADVLTYPNAGNMDGTVGSCYAEGTSNGTAGLVAFFVGTDTNGRLLETSAVTNIRAIDNGAANIAVKTLLQNWAVAGAAPKKIASTWGGTNLKVTSEGQAPAAGASFTLMSTANPIGVGNLFSAANSINGTIKNVRLWTRALADSQLVSLTS